MQKLVNGELIDLTPEEQAAVVAYQAEAQVAHQQQRPVESKHQIDLLADQRRAQFVSPGSLVDQEYALAAQEAQAFKDSGYAEPAPASVTSWAQAASMTNVQAADHILAERDAMHGELNRIRAIRLAKKVAVDALDPATATDADYQSLVDQAKQELFV